MFVSVNLQPSGSQTVAWYGLSKHRLLDSTSNASDLAGNVMVHAHILRSLVKGIEAMSFKFSSLGKDRLSTAGQEG